MIVGHIAISFSVGAYIWFILSSNKQEAVLVGIIASLFTITPDMEIVAGLPVFLFNQISSIYQLQESFFNTADQYHRKATHSLVVLFLVTIGNYFIIKKKSRNRFLVTIFTTIIVFHILIGVIDLTMAIFSIITAVSVYYVTYYFKDKVGVKMIIISSFAGLILHPFGDFFVGTPPTLLYPFITDPTFENIVFFNDSTINILTIYLIEVVLILLSIKIYSKISKISISYLYSNKIISGCLILLYTLILPAPTMEYAYPFMIYLSLLSGIIGGIEVYGERNELLQNNIVRFCLNFSLTSMTGVIVYLIWYVI